MSHCSFTSGWLAAVRKYEQGKTLASIIDDAHTKPERFGRGMLAAVDALAGSFRDARKVAEEEEVPYSRLNELILRTLDA